MNGNCSKCQYYHVEGGQQAALNLKQQSGACRRFPPTAMLLPDGRGGVALTTLFPAVSDKTICGEFVETADFTKS